MKLFVGLGNPGDEYKKNRHNVGFMFVEFLARKMNPLVELKMNPRFAALLADISDGVDKSIVLEPQTYMNRSGEPVSKVASFYKIAETDLFVAHDDLDIPLGKFKIQNGTGPKLHNGLSSIEESLGTADFWRIRIGVENRTEENYLPGEAYVLQNFTHDEAVQLPPLFDRIYEQLRLQKIIALDR